MEKQKLLYQQARLHDRGAAEMVLQTISASKGDTGPMVAATLKLGIAILNGGNSTVQQVMSLSQPHKVLFKQMDHIIIPLNCSSHPRRTSSCKIFHFLCKKKKCIYLMAISSQDSNI